MLVLAVGVLLPAGSHADESPDVLVFGRVSDNPKAQYESMKALLDYVVPRMADVGIREGRILMASDHHQMASYLRRGRVDWVSETAAGGMLLQSSAGVEPLVVSERNGIRRYHTVYFARKDSDVKSLDDLRGHTVAFQNRTSTSAYFVPAIELRERGLPMEILRSPTDRFVPDAVGYVFARTERNISTWVHKRLVDVGTISNLDWANDERVPEFFRKDFVILRETSDLPRGVELVRHNLDARVRERLYEVLIGMSDDPSAQQAMGKFHSSLRFFSLEKQDLIDLERLRAGVARVNAEIE
jgi:phosphonate transport system substrate-binding protein